MNESKEHGLAGGSSVVKPGEAHIQRTFFALAYPVRLQIVHFIHAQQVRGRAICAHHIKAEFGLSQPLVAWHVKTLVKSGLVLAARQGKLKLLLVDEDAFALLASCFDGGRLSWVSPEPEK